MNRIQIKTAKAAMGAKLFAQELSVDFAQHLVDDRDAIDDAADDVKGDRQEGVKGTSAIGRMIRKRMKSVNYLDAIIHNKYSRNPAKLGGAWLCARHNERARQREKKPQTPPTPPQQ